MARLTIELPTKPMGHVRRLHLIVGRLVGFCIHLRSRAATGRDGGSIGRGAASAMASAHRAAAKKDKKRAARRSG
jgi:hypothetical protein